MHNPDQILDASQTNSPKPNRPNDTKPKMGVVRSIFYYGFAIDSIKRSIGRTKRLTKTTTISMFGIVQKIIAESNDLHVATKQNEIESVYLNSAQALIINFIFALLFLVFTFALNQSFLATLANLCICLFFCFQVFTNGVLYIRAKDQFREYNLNSSEKK